MSFAGVFIDELSQSVERAFARASYSPKIPPNDERPTAESHGGDVPQKMCAYGASESSKPAATVTPKGLEVTASRASRTGASLSTETKQEAQRTLTSEQPASITRENSGTPGINFEIASGQQRALDGEAALRPASGVAPIQADSAFGRATAGINEGAGCSPTPQSAPSICCPECHQPREELRIYRCPDCRFIGCGGCMEGHRSEPHWTDGAASRQRESQVRS